MGQKVTGMSELTIKQHAAITALLAGGSDGEAAEAANVNRKTVMRWRSEPDFKTALIEARDALWRQRIDALAAQFDAARAALAAIVADEAAPASTRLAAARIIIDASMKAREHQELAERLAALEEYHRASR